MKMLFILRLTICSLLALNILSCSKSENKKEEPQSEMGLSQDALVEEKNAVFFCEQNSQQGTITKHLDPSIYFTEFSFCHKTTTAEQFCYITSATIQLSSGSALSAATGELQETLQKGNVYLSQVATEKVLNKQTNISFERCCVSANSKTVPTAKQCKDKKQYSYTIAAKEKSVQASGSQQ